MTGSRRRRSAGARSAGRRRPAPGRARRHGRARRSRNPTRAPRTAAYLDGLLGAFDADPLPGESFAFLLALRRRRPDDALRAPRRSSAGGCCRRPGCCGQAALTVDPFVLRGASLGAAWRAERGGAAGARLPRGRRAPLPIASGLPTVVTLLDLAPWELPGAFQRRLASRFGQRLRARLLRDAAAVLVGTERSPGSRPPAAPPAARPDPGRAAGAHAPALRGRARRADAAPRDGGRGATRDRLGLRDRYLVYPGRHDVRQDLGDAARGARRRSPRRAGPRPAPRTRLAAAGPAPRREPGRSGVARPARPRGQGIGERLVYAPALPTRARPRSCRGARRRVLPVLSEASGSGRASTRSRAGVAGRRVGGRGAARDRRRGRDPRRAARPGSAGGGARDRLGRRPRPRRAWPPPPGSARQDAAADLGRRCARDAGRLRGGRPPRRTGAGDPAAAGRGGSRRACRCAGVGDAGGGGLAVLDRRPSSPSA